jgi:hypothetical protein
MPNRYICDVIEELRTCYDTRNFSSLLGLIEECQTLANRMEASLYDRADVRDYQSEIRTLKQEKRTLEFDVEEKKFELEDIKHAIRVKKARKKRRDRGDRNGILVRKDPIPHPGDESTI